MPKSASRICSSAGCYVIVRDGGSKCAKHAKGKRSDQAYEKRRGSFRDRGYTTAWSNLSARYRRENPLCVMCLSRGIVKAVQCVDHIIPVECVPDLVLDEDNCQSACNRCNSAKRFSDPKESWEPDHSRIVVCGLPGTGKTTFAKSTGHPFWDADDHPELTTIEGVQRARGQWITGIDSTSPCVVIVGSTHTAPHVALELRGIVKHMTTVYVNRPVHPLWGHA